MTARTLLVVLAAVASLLPLVAESRQGNSIRWSVDGDEVHCEYFRVPSFSHVRTYRLEKIRAVSEAPDSQNPSVLVVRLHLNGLNLNIPSQSSELIWNFESYLQGLEIFMDRVRGGDRAATYTWYHPWLIVGVLSAVTAVVLWVVVYSLLLFRPLRRETADPAPQP